MASRLVRMNPVTVNDVLDGHVSLDLECLDGIVKLLTLCGGCEDWSLWRLR